MTIRTLDDLLRLNMIYCPTRDSLTHLLRVTAFAARIDRYGHFLERLNYIAPRDDETILLYRDGTPEAMSFFWRQITLVDHGDRLSKAQGFREPLLNDVSHTIDLMMPYEGPSKSYHGGLICRTQYDPIEWSVHT